LVFVDVQKKHTVFPEELDPLGLWLENILFQKLEGIVITGKATGQPVEESDLRQTREAIDKAKAETLAAVGIEWSPQLIVGSGASVANIPMCKRYADAVIVGSSLKKNGYWENPLEEDRVKRFMETWSK
jgi:predicted TIM-barrel enzyme